MSDYINDNYPDGEDEEDCFDYPGTCECRRETAKAILVSDGTEEFWVPKSQLHANSEVYRQGDSGTLVVTAWFAEQRGW